MNRVIFFILQDYKTRSQKRKLISLTFEMAKYKKKF